MKPLLAATVTRDNLKSLPWPLLASPKLDGIRALNIDGQLLSRSLKPLPNLHTQRLIGLTTLHGVDGELIVGTATAADVWNTTTSGVMAVHGNPRVTYHVFDCWDLKLPYVERLTQLKRLVDGRPGVKLVLQTKIHNVEEFLTYVDKVLARGYEGAMLRRADAPYKDGRSTLREAILLKFKVFADDEAVVVGTTELMHNGNVATRNALGQLERGRAKAGLSGLATLGTLVVKWRGKSFEIGTGFSAEQRRQLWARRDKLVGKTVTFKYQPSGTDELPRFPVFKGFRNSIDR